ncbi:hypothetical protein BH10PSE18_BH10PSE18_22250 [soil metagenome]
MDDESAIDFNDPVWAILQSLPSMLSYWDRDLQCRFANRAYEQWFGVRASQLFDSSLRDLLGPELFARSEHYIRGALQGIPQEFDRMPVDSRRPERPGLVNYLPHVVNGKVLGFIVQVTDVSRLHEMQAQLQQQMLETEKACALLRQSEASLQQAQTLGQIGSWEFDVASDTTTWSAQLYELFGRDPALDPPSLGEHALCFSPDSWLRFERTVDRAIRMGEVYTLELEYLHSSGRRGWLEARGAAQRDARGVVVKLHGTAQEISKRRLASNAEAQAARVAELEARLSAAQARISGLEASLAQRSPAR